MNFGKLVKSLKKIDLLQVLLLLACVVLVVLIVRKLYVKKEGFQSTQLLYYYEKQLREEVVDNTTVFASLLDRYKKDRSSTKNFIEEFIELINNSNERHALLLKEIETNLENLVLTLPNCSDPPNYCENVLLKTIIETDIPAYKTEYETKTQLVGSSMLSVEPKIRQLKRSSLQTNLPEKASDNKSVSDQLIESIQSLITSQQLVYNYREEAFTFLVSIMEKYDEALKLIAAADETADRSVGMLTPNAFVPIAPLESSTESQLSLEDIDCNVKKGETPPAGCLKVSPCTTNGTNGIQLVWAMGDKIDTYFTECAKVDEDSKGLCPILEGKDTTPGPTDPVTTVSGDPVTTVSGDPVTTVSGDPVTTVSGDPVTTVSGQCLKDGCKACFALLTQMDNDLKEVRNAVDASCDTCFNEETLGSSSVLRHRLPIKD